MLHFKKWRQRQTPAKGFKPSSSELEVATYLPQAESVYRWLFGTLKYIYISAFLVQALEGDEKPSNFTFLLAQHS
jgi:hypothetical protein